MLVMKCRLGGVAWGEKSRFTLQEERGVARIGKLFMTSCISAGFLLRESTFSNNVNNCIKNAQQTYLVLFNLFKGIK